MRPTALCIGGPLDGERREYNPDAQYMVYVLPWPLKQTKVGDPHPTSVEYDKCTYRIEVLGDIRRIAVAVLVHSGMGQNEMFQRLVSQYPRPKAQIHPFADIPITCDPPTIKIVDNPPREHPVDYGTREDWSAGCCPRCHGAVTTGPRATCQRCNISEPL